MKSHVLHRLLASLYNTPHLADAKTFNIVTSYLDKRNTFGLMKLDEDMDGDEDGDETIDPELGIGVLNVHGALTYKPVMTLCGAVGCSYQDLLDDASEMIEAGVKTIIMDVDSGGGEAYAAFETAAALRQMCDDNGVTLYAYNDGCMASAAYALGCVADEVIANPFAETGSIGVLIALMNDSKALEQEGYARTFITAGASKVPFDADGSWREGFLEDLQTKVDSLYGDFVAHVSAYTGLDASAIKGTEAKMFMSDDALALGLINQVMTRAEFVQYIANKQKE